MALDSDDATSGTTNQEGTLAVSAQDAWYPAGQRDIPIIRQLVTKDFKLKYRRSVLGVAWSVLNPLLMMAVMSVVFTRIMRWADDSIGNYPLYLILGNTAWQLMTDATNSGMCSIIDASSLLKKVKINQYVFPVQKVLFALVNYLFSLVAIFLVMLFFRIPLSANAILLPVALALLTVFCIGLSLLLSAMAVFFRDTIHLWGVFLTAWMYGTPLFYPESILPEWMAALEPFNPMYCFITFIRDVLLWQRMPSASLWIGCIGSAVAAVAIGLIVFNKTKHRFILFI